MMQVTDELRKFMDMLFEEASFLKILIYTKSFKAVKSAKEIVKNYGKKSRSISIVESLEDIARKTKDPEAVRSIMKVVRSYSEEPEIGRAVIENIGYVARRTRDAEAVKASIRAFEAYSEKPRIGLEVIKEIRDVVFWTRDAEAVKVVSEMFLYDEIRETIESYSKDLETERRITRTIGEVIRKTKDPEAVRSIMKVVRSYSEEPEIGRAVIENIGYVVFITGNREALRKFIKVFQNKNIGKYIVENSISPLSIILYSDLIEKYGKKGVDIIALGEFLNRVFERYVEDRFFRNDLIEKFRRKRDLDIDRGEKEFLSRVFARYVKNRFLRD